MKQPDRSFLVAAVFMVSGALAYCSVAWFHIALPRYYPIEHAWKWVSEAGVPSQGWYAGQAFALLVALAAALVVHWMLKRWSASGSPLSPGATRVVAAVTLLVLAGTLGYLMWHEFTKWGVV